MMGTVAPSTQIDLYSDEVISEPYSYYRELRDTAPVVFLARHDAFAIARFDDVRAALRKADIFISGRGVMLNDVVNDLAAGASFLCMDDPQHAEARKVVAAPLSPAALKPLKEQIETLADAHVHELSKRGTFDGVKDFAHFLPLALVRNLVGLPEHGRENMLQWASNIFNVMGPRNERFEQALATRNESRAYLDTLPRDSVLPGSWGARLFDLVDQGVLTDKEARNGLADYTAPALDTTINGLSAAIWLLGENPDQWQMLRDDPSLVSAAIDEALRLESPIRAFSRFTATEVDVDGVTIPAQSRVLILYASANRDERKWEEPERYNIRRKFPQEHLAFGTGVHMCAGMHLAKMEMKAMLEALIRHVPKFRITHTKRDLHNVLRGLSEIGIELD